MDDLFLARNIGNEEIAISNFLNAYVENLESSTTESPNELFAFLLEQLSATCDVVSQEIATPESEGLVSTNQFFESIVRQLQSLEPRRFTLTLNFDDFQTFIDAFQSLKSLAESYPNGSYICERIDYFTSLLNTAITDETSQISKHKKWLIIGSVLIAIGFILQISALFFLDRMIDNGNENIFDILIKIAFPLWIVGGLLIIAVKSKTER